MEWNDIWREIDGICLLTEDTRELEEVQEEKDKVHDTLERFQEEADTASHLLGRF